MGKKNNDPRTCTVGVFEQLFESAVQGAQLPLNARAIGARPGDYLYLVERICSGPRTGRTKTVRVADVVESEGYNVIVG